MTPGTPGIPGTPGTPGTPEPTTDVHVIRDDLCRYVDAHSPQAEPVRVDTDLLGTGVLDSLLVMDLVSHVEKQHGLTLGDADITSEHFRAIESLANLIVLRLNGTA